MRDLEICGMRVIAYYKYINKSGETPTEARYYPHLKHRRRGWRV